MNTTITHSTAGLPNPPTLALRVEKPPVPRVEKEWHAASKPLIPASRRARYSATVRAT